MSMQHVWNPAKSVLEARSMHTAGMKIMKPAQNVPKSHVVSQNKHVILRHGIICYGMVWILGKITYGDRLWGISP